MAESSSLYLREQFATPEQQRETATLGMWIFIVTEMMLFGGLFVAYTVYRLRFPQAFTRGSGEMELWMGAVNTAILICSSLTMALAEVFIAAGRRTWCGIVIGITILLGVIFLGIKFTEYYFHVLDHKLPGYGFIESGPGAQQVQLFFVFYFVMTGLHAFHMMIGIGLLVAMLYPVLLETVSENYHTPIDNVGLYWHFIDVIWVFLYAIFYIPGAHLR